MNSVARRAAAMVLAVALLFPTLAAADPKGRERDRDRSEIVLLWLIQQAKKIAGIVTNGDVLVPPTPLPAPPSKP